MTPFDMLLAFNFGLWVLCLLLLWRRSPWRTDTPPRYKGIVVLRRTGRYDLGECVNGQWFVFGVGPATDVQAWMEIPE